MCSVFHDTSRHAYPIDTVIHRTFGNVMNSNRKLNSAQASLRVASFKEYLFPSNKLSRSHLVQILGVFPKVHCSPSSTNLTSDAEEHVNTE